MSVVVIFKEWFNPASLGLKWQPIS